MHRYLPALFIREGGQVVSVCGQSPAAHPGRLQLWDAGPALGGDLRFGGRVLAAAPLETPRGGTARVNALVRGGAVLWKPALLLGGLLVAGLALRSGWGRSALDAPAQAGPAGFVLVAAAACAVGVPRQVVAYAAGLGFGTWMGCLLALIAEVAGCAADFLWARLVARDWAARRIKGRLARLDGQLSRHPFGATLTLRLLPRGEQHPIECACRGFGGGDGPVSAGLGDRLFAPNAGVRAARRRRAGGPQRAITAGRGGCSCWPPCSGYG